MTFKGFLLSFALSVMVAFGQTESKPNVTVTHITASQCGNRASFIACEGVYFTIAYVEPSANDAGQYFVGYRVTIEFLNDKGTSEVSTQVVPVDMPPLNVTFVKFLLRGITLKHYTVEPLVSYGPGTISADISE